DRRRRVTRADAPPARARKSGRPRPAAGPLCTPLHPSGPSGAHRGSENERMTHSHRHDHGRDGARRALALALALILGLMVGEVVFAILAGSLALLADAGHMLTDAAALALALGAATIAGRPAKGRWTFGFRRLEILAAHVNGITLLVVGVVIVYTAVRRLIDPPEV